jgi:hypothetical protein
VLTDWVSVVLGGAVDVVVVVVGLGSQATLRLAADSGVTEMDWPSQVIVAVSPLLRAKEEEFGAADWAPDMTPRAIPPPTNEAAIATATRMRFLTIMVLPLQI